MELMTVEESDKLKVRNWRGRNILSSEDSSSSSGSEESSGEEGESIECTEYTEVKTFHLMKYINHIEQYKYRFQFVHYNEERYAFTHTIVPWGNSQNGEEDSVKLVRSDGDRWKFQCKYPLI